MSGHLKLPIAHYITYVNLYHWAAKNSKPSPSNGWHNPIQRRDGNSKLIIAAKNNHCVSPEKHHSDFWCLGGWKRFHCTWWAPELCFSGVVHSQVCSWKYLQYNLRKNVGGGFATVMQSRRLIHNINYITGWRVLFPSAIDVSPSVIKHSEGVEFDFVTVTIWLIANITLLLGGYKKNLNATRYFSSLS